MIRIHVDKVGVAFRTGLERSQRTTSHVLSRQAQIRYRWLPCPLGCIFSKTERTGARSIAGRVDGRFRLPCPSRGSRGTSVFLRMYIHAYVAATLCCTWDLNFQCCSVACTRTRPDTCIEPNVPNTEYTSPTPVRESSCALLTIVGALHQQTCVGRVLHYSLCVCLVAAGFCITIPIYRHPQHTHLPQQTDQPILTKSTQCNTLLPRDCWGSAPMIVTRHSMALALVGDACWVWCVSE